MARRSSFAACVAARALALVSAGASAAAYRALRSPTGKLGRAFSGNLRPTGIAARGPRSVRGFMVSMQKQRVS